MRCCFKAGVGYASGKIYELTDENEELVDAITRGDVGVHARMKEHASGFTEFTTYIKRILIGAAVGTWSLLGDSNFCGKVTKPKPKESNSPTLPNQMKNLKLLTEKYKSLNKRGKWDIPYRYYTSNIHPRLCFS